MEEKTFSAKELYGVAGTIVVAIALIETSGPVWSIEFWRQFLLNIIIYVAVSVIAVLLLQSFKK